MPRIRSVKPLFFKDQKVGKIKRDVRLLFIGMWTMADDEGIFSANPVLIKSEIMPFDEDINSAKIGEWIAELEKQQMIIAFSYNNEDYFIIKNWKKHQAINKPQPSDIPLKIIRSVLPERSRRRNGTIRVGKEGKGKERERKGDGGGMIEKILQDKLFLETLSIKWHLSDRNTIKKMLFDFEVNLQASEKDHTEYPEYKKHFLNWGNKTYANYFEDRTQMQY